MNEMFDFYYDPNRKTEKVTLVTINGRIYRYSEMVKQGNTPISSKAKFIGTASINNVSIQNM